ncbi:MAG: hypothetical protein NTV06_07230, partial [candidate division Zixibacteria bacterium]|nr:hypothetical protein [candidate division Zixibacteria bacterium]
HLQLFQKINFLLFSYKLKNYFLIYHKKNLSPSTYRITRLNGVINGSLSDTLYVDRMTSKMEMPLMVGLGTAYHVNDNLLLAADLEFRNFAGKVVENLDSVYFTSSGERIESYYKKDPHWKNIWQFRVGGEYIFNTAVGEIPVRLGFRNEAFPGGDVSNYEVRYPGPKGSSGSNNDSARIAYVFDYNTNQTTGLSISAGTGIRWSQIILDIAYTFTSYKQKFYQDDILKTENKWKNHHLNLTFTGYF